MNSTIHERPGVYSSYDASTAISSGGAGKVIGVAAKAASGDTDQVTTLTSCAGGRSGKTTPADGRISPTIHL